MKEKRQYPRTEKKVKSEVHSTDGMTYSTSSDLSHGGIFISTPEPVTIGSDVRLSIIMQGGENVDVNGVVRWMNEDSKDDKRNGMGIEFINLSDELKEKIKKMMS